MDFKLPKDVQKSMLEVNKAMYNLLMVTDKYNNTIWDTLSEKYPFNMSYDELLYKVQEWVELHCSEEVN